MLRRYIAHTVKGLEKISEGELIDKLKGINILGIIPKKVIFDWNNIPNEPNVFRTIDDLSLLVDSFEYRDINSLYYKLGKIELSSAINTIKKVRKIDNTFSITISKYKAQDVKTDIIFNEIVKQISKRYRLRYTPLLHANLDVRIQVEKNTVYVLIKLFSRSIFIRSYRSEGQVGSLRPSIAGAMLYHISSGRGNFRIIDNFCGSGTFLCEAYLDKNIVFGGDISRKSVEITRKNLEKMKYTYTDRIKTLNAMKTNWPSNYFDIAISNLPWNKQVLVDHFTKLYSNSIIEYGRILKKDGAIALIGSNPDLMVKYVKKIFPDRKNRIESIRIGYLGQNPSIVFSKV